MPPKTSVNQDAPKRRDKSHRPASTHRDGSDKNSPQRESVPRLSLLLLGLRNILALLLQPSNTANETAQESHKPIKKGRVSVKQKKKSDFAYPDNSDTPSSRLDRAVAEMGSPSHKRTRILFSDIEIESERENSKRKKAATRDSQATPTAARSFFSPESHNINGSAFSNDSRDSSPKHRKPKDTPGTANSPVKRGRGRPKGSLNKKLSKSTRIVRANPHTGVRANSKSTMNEDGFSGDLGESIDFETGKSSQHKATSDSKRGKPAKSRNSKLNVLQSLESAILDLPSSEERTSRYAKRASAKDEPDTARKARVVRRASYPERGKRLLSIGNGFEARINPSISESEYNKWFDEDMLEPDKMRQLLIWCFRKKLNQDTNEQDTHRKEILGVSKLIETEILNGLMEGSVSVDWQQLTDDNMYDVPLTGKRIIKPNATNESNKESIEIFAQKLRQLKDEETLWVRAYKNALRPLESLAIDPEKVTERDLLAHLLTRTEGAALIKDVLGQGLEQKMNRDLNETERAMKEDLGDNTDKLLHILHKLKQSLALTAQLDREKLASKVTQLARNFSNRSVLAKDLSVRDLLRGISRIDTSISKVH